MATCSQEEATWYCKYYFYQEYSFHLLSITFVEKFFYFYRVFGRFSMKKKQKKLFTYKLSFYEKGKLVQLSFWLQYVF